VRPLKKFVAFDLFYVVNGVLRERSTMIARLRPAAFVLALIVLAAIVTGVATPATSTVIPKRLTGRWKRDDGEVMIIGRRGMVSFNSALLNKPGWTHAEFLHFTRHPHRLTISGPRWCSRTGIYHWGIGVQYGFRNSWVLTLKKIRDACRLRVSLMNNPADVYSKSA
jgi:hypothetical protein